MSAGVLERRLHGVAIYNPDLLSKDELVAQFIARHDLLDELVADLRRPKFRQHQIIVGNRGMGKTTLLRRLRYAVEDEPKLAKVWMPLTFPEEQYNVARLSDLYLNIVDALGDTLEQRGRREEAAALDAAAESLPRGDEARRAEGALDLLLSTAKRLGRRLLLLVDNLDLVLERLEKQENAQWSLRELLSSEDRILLIGAMPVIIGATYEYNAPFYDFFQIHELHGLSREETRAVLTRLARELEVPAVEQLIEKDPARIDTLHTLTAGNPRTIVLLFGVLAQGTDGDVRSDLEKLLDQCTPLYKSRFEALPAQAQQVVDAVAIHWDPISAGELAEKLPLDVNAISAQLNRLVSQGVLEKVEYHPATKIGFQVAERFFNIWYLMRASRRVRRRLIWLVEFLRLFYGVEQVKSKARDLLHGSRLESRTEKLRHAEFCLAIAQLIQDDQSTRVALESSAIRTLLADTQLSAQLTAMFDLDGDDAALRGVVDREQWIRDFSSAIDQSGLRGVTKQRARTLIAASGSTREYRLAMARALISMPAPERRAYLARLEADALLMQELAGPTFANDVQRALAMGFMDDLDDEAGGRAAAVALNLPALPAGFLSKSTESIEELRTILAATDAPFVKVLLAEVVGRQGGLEESVALLSSARQQERFSYQDEVEGHVLYIAGRYRKAAEAFARVVTHYRVPESLVRHGDSLTKLRRYAEAEPLYRKALAEAPADLRAAQGLALSLIQTGQFDEAVKFTRSLAESGDSFIRWIEAEALLEMKRIEEAHQVLSELARFEDRAPSPITLAVVHTFFMMGAGEDAATLLRRLLGSDSGEFIHQRVGELLSVINTAAIVGHAQTLIGILESFNLQDSLRPAYEALRIYASGDDKALKRLAPEIRDTAVQLLADWRESAAAAGGIGTLTATPKRRSPRKRRVNR